MKTKQIALAVAVAAAFSLLSSYAAVAEASGKSGGTSIHVAYPGGYFGYSGSRYRTYSFGHGFRGHGRGHYDWHDTSHYDWHPGQYRWHGNHYDYVPGHYDFHRDGHWDYHRGGHHGSRGHHGHHGR